MNIMPIKQIERRLQTLQRWLTTRTEPVAPSHSDTAPGLAVRTDLKAGGPGEDQVVFVQPPSYH